MTTQLTAADLLPLAQRVAAVLEAENEAITALDAAIGDGDLGVTCRLGMQAVVEGADAGGGNLSEMLLKAGMRFNSAGASTYGALVATAAMQAAKVAKERQLEAWDLPALTAALAAACEGITRRGGAQRGDKTLLDALYPALDVLQAAEAAGQSLAEALPGAATAAAEGAAATAPLKSKFGRAGWLQERTIGQPDPGARVAALVLQALAEYVTEQG